MTVGELIKRYKLPLKDLDVIWRGYEKEFHIRREELGRNIKSGDLPDDVYDAEVKDFLLITSRHFVITVRDEKHEIMQGQIRINEIE